MKRCLEQGGDFPSRELPIQDYIRRSNDAVEAAAEYGSKVALHNHPGCRIQDQDELDEFMEKVPGAWLLPDTGHLMAIVVSFPGYPMKNF